MTQLFFYQPATEDNAPRAIDAILTRADGTKIGVYSSKTQEELAEQYGTIGVETIEGLERLALDYHRRPVEEIDIEVFDDALDVLPPEDWQHDAIGESFKMAEHLSGQITHIYARIGKRYFAFTDTAALPHAEIMARVINFMEATKNG